MEDIQRESWPQGWPSALRAILHVAIATGAGNVVIAIGVSVLVSLRTHPVLSHRWAFVVLASVIAEAAVIAAAATSAYLVDGDRTNLLAIIYSYSLGALSAILALPLAALAWPEAHPCIGLAPIAGLSSAITTYLFSRFNAKMSSGELVSVAILGTAMLSLSAGWAHFLTEAQVAYFLGRHIRWAPGALLIMSMWACLGLPLTCAVTARIFVRRSK